MLINAAAIKAAIREQGIDLVAVADAKDLLLAYPPRPAGALLPSARSVIVMAVAHSLASVYAPDIRLWTRNKMQTSRLLDQAAEKIGRLLEGEGYLSLPISADKPVEIHKLDPATGKRFPHTKVVGHLSLKHAAVSAGLGRIGRSNLLLTDSFGPHQRLGAVVTEAPLEPDPCRQGDPCPPGCRRCEDACPVAALKDGRYQADPCFTYWSTGFPMMRPRRLRQWPAYLRILLEHQRRRDWFIELGQTYITDVDYCIECLKACPIGKHWQKMRPRANPP